MKIVYASSTARVTVHGVGVLVQKGQHWPESDPVVRQHPDLFSADARYGLVYTAEPAGYGEPVMAEDDTPPVERATANPGERREARRRY